LRRRRDERAVREDVEGRYRLPIAGEQSVDARAQRTAPKHRAVNVMAELQREAPIHDDGRQAQPHVPLLDHGTVMRLREEIPAALRLADIKREKILKVRRDADDAVRFLHEEILELEARAASYRRVLQLADAPLPAAPPEPARFYAAANGALFHDSGAGGVDQPLPDEYLAATALDLGDGTQPDAEAAPPPVPEPAVGSGWWDRVADGHALHNAAAAGGAL
jgi:hypothetical protein